MALALVYSRANIGIEAPLVTVEVHLSSGLPAFNIVGLPETAVKESRERVRSAILNANLEFPQRRITINLAPADLPKAGGRFDLAIAVGILAASRQIDKEKISQMEFMGELALTGEVRRVSGLLPGLLAGTRVGHYCVVPAANALEAGLLQQGDIGLCNHLQQLLQSLHDNLALQKPEPPALPDEVTTLDYADVVGQESAKRAMLIAAAGGHNLLMYGPPGTGKTMLASRLPGILPPLDHEAAMEVVALHSLSNRITFSARWQQAPFRAPHHTSSAVALVGGGSSLNTGEISLAHHGVLFLDELPEFSPKVLDGLRQPMESGHIRISRARYQVCLPASFQLIAAMNPCPCGHYGNPERECRCTPDRIRNYQQRISGPLLDRIDLHIRVAGLGKTERESLLKCTASAFVRRGLNSQTMRQMVQQCRELQLQRAGVLNARLEQSQITAHCALQAKDQTLLADLMHKLRLSPRACMRILKIARTLADLENVSGIKSAHLLEAAGYRQSAEPCSAFSA